MKILEKTKEGDTLKIKLFGLIKFSYKKKVEASEEQKIFEKYRSAERFEQKRMNFKGRYLIIPDLPSFAYQIKDIFIDKVYNFKADNDAPVIYDCGANIGISIMFFKELYPNSKIKAFEPDEKIYKVLRENIKDLQNVELFQNAVWKNNDELCFNSEGADAGSLINEFNTKQSVKAIRLKEMIQQEKIVDFLKMDIEGAEVEVIEDCREELKKVKNIFIEYHSIVGRSQELDNILLSLTNAGFRYHLQNVSTQTKPFIKRTIFSNMDLQVNIFGYRG